jgi:Fe-S cluster biogenesis protein NfuA
MFEEKVKEVLEDIRPRLQLDGGDIELVSADEKTGVVKVKLQGHCAHCPMAEMTLKMTVEAELMDRVPEVKEVVT